MSNNTEVIGKGGVLIEGAIEAPILISKQGFNGVAAWTKEENFKDGHEAVCYDWQHEWNGVDLKGKIIAFPTEVGSTHAPLPYIDLVKDKNGPAGIIVTVPDPLVAIGVIISKEWYGPSIPLIEFPIDELEKHVKNGDIVQIQEDGTISIKKS
ncbi:aconitase X swivel domain-containing protein [Sediminitomix flava]|uniref:Putative aconitase subunit 2 n=1 Tax=Sediminitomix flava TaxID=379075 RepID=A0A315Z4Y5_SEDFL|nr:DUF126 domain-containing protein [Sediminitomix flava]PWJ38538.1 putative aconitase subunit 2 [Sediminitomix flava]